MYSPKTGGAVEFSLPAFPKLIKLLIFSDVAVAFARNTANAHDEHNGAGTGEATEDLKIEQNIRSVESPNEGNPKASTKPLRLVWHRRDLRLHDNPLYENHQDTRILSVYIFEDSYYQPRPSTCRPDVWSAVTTGPWAAVVELAAVKDLRNSLRNVGSDLVVCQGSSVKILVDLVHRWQPTEVWWQEEPGIYEATLSQSVRKALRTHDPNIGIRTTMSYTLYHPEDLPLPGQWQTSKKKRSKALKSAATRQPNNDETLDILASNMQCIDISPSRWKGLPRLMNDFRRIAGTRPIRPCLPTPTQLQPCTLTLEHVGDIPTIMQLYQPLLDYLQQPTHKPLLGLPYPIIEQVIVWAAEHVPQQGSTTDDSLLGGESVALQHLQV
jgi:deoxyribodipyrimidine photo-lyase